MRIHDPRWIRLRILPPPGGETQETQDTGSEGGRADRGGHALPGGLNLHAYTHCPSCNAIKHRVGKCANCGYQVD
ncbi:MAG: hypothetical protein M0R06_14975 [Sphaerochaeta sp.]|nr:hypothetical protein [Sphaerochaeta sp.]